MVNDDLQITVDKEIGFEIIVILAKRIDHAFRHFEPAHVEKELNAIENVNE